MMKFMKSLYSWWKYYYHSMSMEEIADRMNYKNRFTSKNLKYKCINRLRRIYIEELKKQNNKVL
jgi:hypothetical protein